MSALVLPIHTVRDVAEARRLRVFVDRARPLDDDADLARIICEQVRTGGDRVLRELTRKYDGVNVEFLRVDESEIDSAPAAVPHVVREALELAASRIRRFHEATAPARRVETSNGLRMWREFIAFQAAGLYVPGGSATYPSSVLMLALPARVAGVPRLALATPPGAGGALPAAVLCAAKLAGVTEVYRIGGAQAIAALAYGTESIPPVDIVVGPGNRHVTAAKKVVYGRVAVDALAGPSEIAVISDGSAPAMWVALDVLAQLEHSADARALVVSTSPGWIQELVGDLTRVAESSRRREHLGSAIRRSAALLVPDVVTAAAVVSAYAPEHLSILTRHPEDTAARVDSAGAIFLGPFAPVAIGDYLAGPSHTLPTGGSARCFSGVGVESFGRWVSVIGGDAVSLSSLLEPAAILAEVEGLPGHAASLRARAIALAPAGRRGD